MLDEVAEKVQRQACTTDDNEYNILIGYTHALLQLCIVTS